MSIGQNELKTRVFEGIGLSVIWLPVLLIHIVNQYQYFSKKIFLTAAMISGYDKVQDLTIADFTYFFRSTIIEYAFIFPLLTILFCILTRSIALRLIILFVALAIVLMNFSNIMSIGNVGNLSSYTYMVSALDWILTDHETLFSFVSKSALLKIGVFLSSLFFIFGIAQLRKGTLHLIFKHGSILSCISGVFIGIGFLVYSISANVKDAYDYESYTLKQIKSFIEQEEILTEVTSFKDKTEDIIQSFRQETKSLPNPINESYFGKEKNHNIIFFVMESAPNAVTVEFKNQELFKNINSIRSKAFYSENHYTTFPYTSDGLFSVFSSLYPIKVRREVALGESELSEFGFLSILKNLDYSTGVYSMYEFEAEGDRRMFDTLGASIQYFAQQDEGTPEKVTHLVQGIKKSPPFNFELSDFHEKFYNKFSYDQVTFDQMLEDIESYSADNQKFASVFLPQIGHGPWYQFENSENIIENGALQMSVHDIWFGELVDKLEKLGILNETIIVLTSDHGLRAMVEYPDLNGAFMEDITYNVPLFIYAPGTLQSEEKINEITSHIDLMPTLLHLMGIEFNKNCTLGLPIWDQNIGSRRLYFNGQDYFGLSGYKENGKVVSYNYFQKRFYENNDMGFNVHDYVQDDAEVRKYKVEYQKEFQRELLNMMKNGQYCIN